MLIAYAGVESEKNYRNAEIKNFFRKQSSQFSNFLDIQLYETDIILRRYIFFNFLFLMMKRKSEEI